jgi:uncharacterized protein YegL
MWFICQFLLLFVSLCCYNSDKMTHICNIIAFVSSTIFNSLPFISTITIFFSLGDFVMTFHKRINNLWKYYRELHFFKVIKKVLLITNKSFGNKILIIIPVIFLLHACETPTKEEIKQVKQGCTLTIEQLATQNSISDECRTALKNLLPNNDDNISSALVKLGRQQGRFIILASNSGGSPLQLTETGKLKVTQIKSDGETLLAENQYTIGKLKDLSNFSAAISMIMDYSGSMREEDIKDANEIFDDFYEVFDVLLPYHSNIILFSEQSHQIQPFTNDTATLRSQLFVHPEINRSSTALFDAMGETLNQLGERNDTMKLLIISTDGHENSSNSFTNKNEIIDLVNRHKVPVIFVATLLSDIKLIKEFAEKTDSLYIYAKEYLEVKTKSQQIIDMLKQALVVDVNTAINDAKAIKIDYQGKSVRFDTN